MEPNKYLLAEEVIFPSWLQQQKWTSAWADGLAVKEGQVTQARGKPVKGVRVKRLAQIPMGLQKQKQTTNNFPLSNAIVSMQS